ncbi:MAG TPA: alpha/beta fold hydrolase [Candidatus Saccharimonadales bacterium]|nr:alpha/beta fold hydrolase [Candidatus Saccharimonadales bacterium]
MTTHTLPLKKSVISVDTHDIACEYNIRDSNAVILHGAGQADRKRYYAFAQALLRRNIGVLLFDFSGHGDSSGSLTELSLAKRTHQAQAVINAFIPQKNPLYLIGLSMSGQTVIDLLPHLGNRVKGVLLGCPAIYTKKVNELPFGDPVFSATIRQKDSWKNSTAFSTLPTFKGTCIITIGNEDTVIPSEVIQSLQSLAPDSYFKEYPDVSHQLAAWLGEHPKELSNLFDKLFSIGRLSS